ncbi:hypothetical protein C8Q78DRAFT_988367 [Trametes maxima]|nr:hypothetical protein C8Q78DRAFT_988367 [Trametes maxima]
MGWFEDAEVEWLLQELNSESVKKQIRETSKEKRVLYVKNTLVDRYQEHFTSPRPAESDTQFNARVKKARPAERGALVRKPAQTQEEFDAADKTLTDRMYKWVNYQLNTVPKRQKDAPSTSRSVEPQPLPKSRQARSLSAFNVFQKTVPTDHKGGKFSLPEFRKFCLEKFNDLTEEERAEYGAQAAEFNRKLREKDISGPTLEPELVGTWMDEGFDQLTNSLDWGGMWIAGGPGRDGEKDYYITCRGSNRQGDSLLDALLRMVKWSHKEFESFVSLWLEQAQTGPQRSPEELEDTELSSARNVMQGMLPFAPPDLKGKGREVSSTTVPQSNDLPGTSPTTNAQRTHGTTETLQPRPRISPVTPRSSTRNAPASRPSSHSITPTPASGTVSTQSPFTIIRGDDADMETELSRSMLLWRCTCTHMTVAVLHANHDEEGLQVGDTLDSETTQATTSSQTKAGAGARRSKQGKKKPETTGLLLPTPDPATESLVTSRAGRVRRVKNRQDMNDGTCSPPSCWIKPIPLMPDVCEPPWVRVLIWTEVQNDALPLVRIVPLSEDGHLCGAGVRWINHACGGALVGGVERCIHFGAELELLNQVYAASVTGTLEPSRSRAHNKVTPTACVLVWTMNALRAKEIYVPVDSDRTVTLKANPRIQYLLEDSRDEDVLMRLGFIDTWDAQNTGWMQHRIDEPLPVPEGCGLLLVKMPAVPLIRGCQQPLGSWTAPGTFMWGSDTGLPTKEPYARLRTW